MVEVYRTNVKDYRQADLLLNQLAEIFPGYEINFDLEDRDRILRVESDLETIDVPGIITLVRSFGFKAQILPHTLGYTEDELFIDASGDSFSIRKNSAGIHSNTIADRLDSH